MGTQSGSSVDWAFMLVIASVREQEELSVFSSLPSATVKEAAWVEPEKIMNRLAEATREMRRCFSLDT